MEEPKTVTIVLKDSEKRTSQKFLIYESFQMNSEEMIIKRCIAEALKSFDGKPESVNVRVSMEVI